MKIARALSIGLVGVFSLVGLLSASCDKKQEGLSDKECSDLKQQAFKIINSGKDNGGQTCNTDKQGADCSETKWPECRHAVNTGSQAALAELQKKFEDGKCKGGGGACSDSPPTYCKQGLCAMREPGTKDP